jgi:hypothetical protein
MKLGRHPNLGSTLRFSQPPSGFLASSNLVALFHATATQAFSFRVFPSQKLCTPLEATGFLVVIHQRAWRAPPWTVRRNFHRLPLCCERLRGSCNDYERPFHRSRRNDFPNDSGPKATGSRLPASFTHFEAFHLLRVRSHRPELPRASGRYSPELLPLQSIPLHTLEPQPARVSRPEHGPRTDVCATKKTISLQGRVSPTSTHE